MRDVTDQLRGYGEQLETLVELGTTEFPLREPVRRGGGFVPALVGAVVALAFIGGVAMVANRSNTGIPSFGMQDIPSFRAVLAYPSSGEGLSSGTVEVRYDASDGALAIEVTGEQRGLLDGSFGPGSGGFLAYDGEVTTVGLAEDDVAFQVADEEMDRSGLGEYAWPTFWTEKCADGRLIGSSTLVGRPVIGTFCSAGGREWNVWVDAEMGVVLKVDGPIEPRLDPMFGTEVGFEAISVEYDPEFSADDFAGLVSQRQKRLLEDARARDNKILAFPPFQTRVSREFRGEAASEAGVESWSDERIFWYMPGLGVRYEVVSNSLEGSYDSPGSFTVSTVDEIGHFEAASNTWTLGEGSSNYTDLLEVGPSDEQLETECDKLSDKAHIGRVVHRYENCHLDGTDSLYTVWVDVDTGLLLLRDSPLERYEVLELETDPGFPDDWFDFIPPPTAKELGTDPWAGLRFGPGDETPAFHGRFLDGSPFDLTELRGTPVLVYLWASWCPVDTCGMAKAQQLHETYGGSVTVVAFASQDDPTSVRSIVGELDSLTVPIALCDPTCKPDDPGPLWGIPGYPFWVLIDGDGNAAQVFNWNSTIEEIGVAIDQAAG